MKILAIDTSCDDTSAAVVVDGMVISNIISSQINFHKEWGGVVPSLAKRLHSEKIDIVIQKALERARVEINDIDVFAVTYGPGLSIALEVGVKKAIELSTINKKPLLGINHMEGHIYASFAKDSVGNSKIANIQFPYMTLLVSGGHTELVLMKEHGVYEKVGVTLDDAVGEAFDKAGRMIKVGYPGGPIISEFAKKGDIKKYPLPIPLEKSPGIKFSYSGLKSAFQRLVSTVEANEGLDAQTIYDLSAVFQNSALEELIQQTGRALKIYKVNGLILGGGVSANIELRKRLRKLIKPHNIPLYTPLNMKLCMDNAAMIGVCAYWKIKTNTQKFAENNQLDRDPNLSL